MTPFFNGGVFYFLYIYHYMKIIITEKQINLLKKGSLADNLLSQIEENGWIETSELVGGYKNLLNIVGHDKLVDLLISSFGDLNVKPMGTSIFLRDNHLPLLEKTSSFWGSDVRVYNDHIIIRLELRLGSDIIEPYQKVRREFIRELINRFPELQGTNVEVFKDSGLYKKYDSFEL